MPLLAVVAAVSCLAASTATDLLLHVLPRTCCCIYCHGPAAALYACGCWLPGWACVVQMLVCESSKTGVQRYKHTLVVDLGGLTLSMLQGKKRQVHDTSPLAQRKPADCLHACR
jgi:hypothetical protein